MAGVTLFYFSFFHGDAMAGIFARDPQVVAAAADYLKAYAIDCILTSFLFACGDISMDAVRPFSLWSRGSWEPSV